MSLIWEIGRAILLCHQIIYPIKMIIKEKKYIFKILEKMVIKFVGKTGVYRGITVISVC